MDKKDFSDIGYHYVVDCTGVIAEGRDIRFKGSHVNKNNAKKIGILLLGDFSKKEKLNFLLQILVHGLINLILLI